jgi:hypothetical protein
MRPGDKVPLGLPYRKEVIFPVYVLALAASGVKSNTAKERRKIILIFIIITFTLLRKIDETPSSGKCNINQHKPDFPCKNLIKIYIRDK